MTNITMTRAEAQKLREALAEALFHGNQAFTDRVNAALAALDRLLAQTEQEPVAWIPFTDSIYRDETAYKILLPWLEGHSKERCASMTVVFNKFDRIWISTFWHGNRGYDIGRSRDIEGAKQSCIDRLNAMRSALAAAPIAQPQEPHGCACRWDENDNRVATCARHQGWLDVVREWADRAKDAEAKLKAAPAAQHDEADELLRKWGFDPDTYRTDGGAINHLKVKAALLHPNDYPRMACQHEYVDAPASFGGRICKHCSRLEVAASVAQPEREPDGCGHEACDCRWYCQKQAAPVAQPEQEPVASLYIDAGGEREIDDWRVQLPAGRYELFAAPTTQPDAEDAARYRWLKARIAGAVPMVRVQIMRKGQYVLIERKLDAAIDAARAAEKGGA